MTTKQWSTATLNDGVAHVQKIAKQELEESESDLERQLEDCYLCRKKTNVEFGDLYTDCNLQLGPTNRTIPEELQRQIDCCPDQDVTWMGKTQFGGLPNTFQTI